VEAFAAGLRRGRSAISKLTLFDTSGCRSELGGQAAEPVLPASLSLSPHASRPDRFGIAAALAAVQQAGLSQAHLRHAGVLFGTGCGGAMETESYLREVLGGRLPAASGLIPHQPSAVTDFVAGLLGSVGPRTTIMTACSSSAIAISQGKDLIALGQAEVAVCGGAEGLCRLTTAGFGALRATSSEPCRPFDKDRKGLNLGEGAAVLVLESAAHARRRQAWPLARLLGAGLSCDAYHMTAPHPQGDGALRAMRAACADAGIFPEAIDYINAHGTGTPHNDSAETAAVRALLGERSAKVPLSSIKSMVGHTLGAAGAIEAVASVLSLREGFLPPTANLETPDPAFGGSSDFDFVMGPAREQAVDVVMSSSFAFGGNNAVLIFARA
jgi:3-oxoacyl-[acyl-carrier-protein] synthase II